MALTPEDRKKKLGHGGLTKVARRLDLTPGHVTEVNAERRRDERVERAIEKAIVRKHPEINPADVWPWPVAAESRDVAGVGSTQPQ